MSRYLKDKAPIQPVAIWSMGSLWGLFPPLPIHFAVIVTVCASMPKVNFITVYLPDKARTFKADIEQLALDHFATQTFQHKLHAYIWHKEAGFHAIQQSPIQKPIRKISMHSIEGKYVTHSAKINSYQNRSLRCD